MAGAATLNTALPLSRSLLNKSQIHLVFNPRKYYSMVVFLLREKYFLFERYKKQFFLRFGQYDKEKQNVLKQCQSNESTNHGERGVVPQTPKQM